MAQGTFLSKKTFQIRAMHFLKSINVSKIKSLKIGSAHHSSTSTLIDIETLWQSFTKPVLSSAVVDDKAKIKHRLSSAVVECR